MLTITNFINGKHVRPANRKYLETFEPATGKVLAKVPDSTAEDVNQAVKAAADRFDLWSKHISVERRAACLYALADLIDQNAEHLAEAESRDTGKPLSLAKRVDIPRAAANFRFFAGAVLHHHGETHSGQAGFNYTLRQPRGVAALISPWNLPLYLLSWKIAPAIATGNTCVCKPSEVTPLTAYLLGDLINQAGIPPGVVNIVHGTGQRAGAALVQHLDVPTISFTGSTAVGRWIGEHAGKTLKRASLELGGKNPFIIFDDADLPQAIATAAAAAFTNQGQICLCGSRLLVHRPVYQQVLDGLVAAAKALKVGDPADESTQFGALTSKPHLEKVHALVKAASKLGAKLHCGGGPVPAKSLPKPNKSGYFFQPTVLSGLDPFCKVEQEEIFGPVVSLQPFDTAHEAIALANCTPYGLAATIFTTNLRRAHDTAAAIDAGIIWINTWLARDLRTPFGGMKQSGLGREGGVDALKFFTEPKNVCIG